ncbi:MAG: ABC transporter permease [Anaerolineales bacterium]|nr:ABC transporter permease [Anaerolineales bacterium]
MTRYIIRRLLQLVPILFLISMIVFVLLQLAPGDPAAALEDNPNLTAEDRARFEERLGLNDPLHIKYFKWLGNTLQGNWGVSVATKRPVLEEIGSRLPNTLRLMITAQVITLLIAIPIGIISAVKQYSLFDHVSTTFAFMGQSIPVFWFGLMLIMIFSMTLKTADGGPLLPGGGMYDLRLYDEATAPFADRLRHMILPVAMLAMLGVGTYTRYTRGSMLEVLRQDYLRTARAKGQKERRVVLIHALKNAAIPIITILALDLPSVFGGAIFTETIFSWPGMGRLFIDAANRSDYDLLMGIVLMNAMLILIFNLIADVLYAVLDPRVRYE